MIQDKDGLYLNGLLVAPASGIGVTFQGNDLTKPDSLETSYSNTFTLPDSLDVRGLTRNAEQLDAGAGVAYQVFDAYIIDQGETTFRGFAELNSFSEGWSITLYESKLGLFEKLDRSIRTADLSRFDHKWNLEGINSLIAADSGACYPAVDYGLLDSGELPLDAIFPAVYAHTIVDQMLSEEGYKLVGNLPKDPLYKALTLPFVDDKPTSKDQLFQDDRKARIGLDLPDYGFDSNRNKVGRYQPYTVDNRPLDAWEQGKLRNFNTSTFTYTCDTAMRLRVEVFQAFKLRVRGGEFEVILTIEKNGQEVARNYQNYDTGHNLFNLAVDTIQLNELIACQKGDTLRVRFVAQRRTTFGGFDCTIYGQPDQAWVSYLPDLTLVLGDLWNVSRNLPDILGFQLLKTIAFICSGTYSVDNLRREITLHTLNETVNDTANAVDWSDRVSELQNLNWQPRIDPYGRRNLLKWKETDGNEKGYADGVISVSASNITTDVNLFELPFSASSLSLQTIPGYGNPVLIPLRTISRAGGNITINNQTSGPRLLLNYPGAFIGVRTKVFDKDGNPSPEVVFLQSCWFGGRPNITVNNSTNFSLAFDSVGDSRGERTLIQRYYSGLIRVLRRPRMATITMYLDPVDMATLDFNKPVRLKGVRVGPLQITDNYFYLNKISNYQAGKPVAVTLACFD